MNQKISVDLSDVQKTLLLPLWGRAAEAKKKKPLLVDSAASRVIDTIDFDFSTIANNINPITRLAWIVRSMHIDDCIRAYLRNHPGATVVNIGCGLDTTFERVDNGSLRWFDLDLPDVIELRRKFIDEGPRRRFLSCSFFDDGWKRLISPAGDGVFFAAAGVLYYFEESEVRKALTALAGEFPGGEMILDTATPLGVRVSNKKVLEAGGMDRGTVLRWGLTRAGEIRRWDDRIRIIAEYPMFRGAKKGLSFGEKFGTTASDFLRIMSMVHLGFTG
ncbi:MAG TPA: class I SAM-dependent methyltransferase [Bacteroidota bacterium]|nr:class I SAM-dependent methyltransferase [Bacteroidota bacterium]